MLKHFLSWIKKEVVLCAAILLAIISCFLVPPSLNYISYIDWDTLALLFSLMAVMKGFQNAGLFIYLGTRLLSRAGSTRKMLLILVFLPFILSTLITNDVALLTFVPFSIIVLRIAHKEHLLVPLVVLQTLAANLGSMLTPMGNPQNLYLYAASGIGFGGLCLLMLPYVLISALCLFFLIVLRKSTPLESTAFSSSIQDHRALLYYSLGLVICLLGIFNLLSPLLIAALVAIFLLVVNRRLLRSLDYALLGTFFAFFIFIGNLGQTASFQSFLRSILSGHEQIVAIITSQVISNVPTALLLSGFTSQWEGLIVGCNLGGLGTLIASMASLISYKFVVQSYPAKRKTYFLTFTVYNIGMLLVLEFASFFLA